MTDTTVIVCVIVVVLVVIVAVLIIGCSGHPCKTKSPHRRRDESPSCQTFTDPATTIPPVISESDPSVAESSSFVPRSDSSIENPPSTLRSSPTAAGPQPDPSVADYIIIGGGTAGSVLAKRLTDDGVTSVLVLEGGPAFDCLPIVQDSTNTPQLINVPALFWPGQSVPQAQLNGRQLDYTGGKLLGGSSSVNGQVAARATSDVVKEWFRSTGDPDWTLTNVYLTWRDIETYEGVSSNPFLRGTQGPVHIRQAPIRGTSMARKFVDAVTKTTSYPEILDYNDTATPLGPFTRWQLLQRPDEARESGSTAYLRFNMTVDPSGMFATGTNATKEFGGAGMGPPRQLLILFNAPVRRVLFDGTRAMGVEYTRIPPPPVPTLSDGSERPPISGDAGAVLQAFARKGVIVCAGVHSPEILLRSGVGPAANLKEAGVPVVVDSPNVGQNLTDHTLLFLTGTANPDDVGVPPDDPAALYVGGAYLPDPSLLDSRRRGIQLFCQNPSQGMLSVGLIPLQPRSRDGTITLNRDRTTSVNLNYLSDPTDLYTLMAATRQVAEIVRNMGPGYQITTPNPEILADDTKLEEFIRQNLVQSYEWVSSCRMGRDITTSVVDGSGRVFGTSNLYVADNTIIPSPSDSDTTEPAFLVGNIVAKKILREQGIKSSPHPCIKG